MSTTMPMITDMTMGTITTAITITAMTIIMDMTTATTITITTMRPSTIIIMPRMAAFIMDMALPGCMFRA